MSRDTRSAVLTAVIVVWAAALIASGIAPYDRFTWIMEVAPVLIAIPFLIATRRQLPLTTLLYVLVCIHGLILIYGAMYTYARTPLGFELQALFGFERNPYDRVGHFAQGFVPAIVARELLIRVFRLKPGGLMLFLVTCIALAVSAFYELIEWWSALVMGQAADEFLGTQGDPWDTQWDMFLALVGALVAQFALARWHDRQIARAEAEA